MASSSASAVSKSGVGCFCRVTRCLPAPDGAGSVLHASAGGDFGRIAPVRLAARIATRMAQSYTASDIEVLTGLEPVRRRPGMYTDTRSPNHLVHEVVDNSVDEALSGHCEHIGVTLHKDGSVSVEDDGRGMPVDIHPKEKVSGVELILTRLHAGGKFSDKNYESAGGLHGVGVSVVNALSKHLECNVRRDGKEWNIGFKNGKVVSKLEAVGTAKRGETGTTVRFWPDPAFFDSAEHLGAAPQARPQGEGRAVPGTAGPARRSRRAARPRSGTSPATSAPTCSSSSARRSACRRSRTRARSRAATRARTGRCAGRRTPSRRSPRAT